MSEIKEMLDKKTDYENFYAQCPYCEEWNTYNRITDLKTLEPIWGMDVRCFHCNKEFRILYDVFDMGFKILLSDCKSFIQTKKYMYCIINLCMAYEMFFLTYLYVNLVLKPLKTISENSRIDEHNRLSELLYKKIETYPYQKMLGCFIDLVIKESSNSINSITDAENHINNIQGNMPNDADIKGISDLRLRRYLLLIKGLNCKRKGINNIRNKIAHKYGYRPHFKEVKKELKRAETLIHGLSRKLKLTTDDMQVYLILNK